MTDRPATVLDRVLVTGGCGFIGANLVRRVAERGLARALRVVDDESAGSRDAIAPYDAEFIRGDFRDPDLMRRALRGVDAVVHLAARTSVVDSIADPAADFDANVAGTFRLLTLMREAGTPRLVNASTGGAILGEAPPPVHEAMAPQPASPYGAGKASGEAYCSAFAASYGLGAVSLRFSNVYGPMSLHKGSVVAAFMRRILDNEPLVVHGDGSQTRDYVFVEDLCDGIAAAAVSDVSGTFQLGSGVGTTVNQLIDRIAKATGRLRPRVRYDPFRVGEIRHTWADVAKAREGLGWTPSTGLPEGLARTWSWFLTRQPAAARTGA